MLSKTLTVVNPSGLHLRPAGVLSQTAMKFKCDVLIECGDSLDSNIQLVFNNARLAARTAAALCSMN